MIDKLLLAVEALGGWHNYPSWKDGKWKEMLPLGILKARLAKVLENKMQENPLNMSSGQWPKYLQITFPVHHGWGKKALSLVCSLTDSSVTSGNLLHLAASFPSPQRI